MKHQRELLQLLAAIKSCEDDDSRFFRHHKDFAASAPLGLLTAGISEDCFRSTFLTWDQTQRQLLAAYEVHT